MISPLRTSALFLALLATGVSPSAAQTAELRAGAAAVDITPQRLPVSMTGSFQDRQATAVHDPLAARCLVLDDGTTRLALVICDSALVSQEIFDRAKEAAAERTGIPTSHMLMAATHTHSAATAMPLAQCRPDPEYVQFLTRGLARSVEEAQRQLRPARLGWAVGQEPAEVHNRRWFVKPEAIPVNPFGRADDRVRTNPPAGSEVLIRPAGPVDPDLAILSVQEADGQPLALVANYALHYVGGIPPGQLSADYFGEFARRMGERLEASERFVGMMSNAASGDVNNINFRQPRPSSAPFVRVREVASRLAEVAHASYRSIEHTDQVSLGSLERTIELGVRRPHPIEVERARELLAQAGDPERLDTAELYAQETLRLADHPPTVMVKLQAMRIGSVGIAAIPCEPFVEIGLEIKRASPLQPAWVISLANGYHGYLPTPEQHGLGGYETWRSGWSYLEEDASTRIREVLLEMLEQLAKEPTRKAAD